MELKEAFSSLDGGGNETIATKNLGAVLSRLGQNPSEEELQDMTNRADAKATGTIGLFMFLMLMTGKLDKDGRPIKKQRCV